MILIRVLCILTGYCFGLIQTSYIIGKMNGIDIRDFGSGNAGTTNALRTLGTKVGIFVFFGDALKSLFAVLLVRWIFRASYPDLNVLLGMYAGAGAVLGHIYPFYMNFRGGKGVACIAGTIASFNIPLTIIEILVFGLTAILTNYVSLGSLLVGATFLAGTIVLGQLGMVKMDPAYLPELYAVVFFVVALCYYKHRGNIKRLLTGTERKSHLFGNKGSKEKKK